jgi:hypothetical protein
MRWSEAGSRGWRQRKGEEGPGWRNGLAWASLKTVEIHEIEEIGQCEHVGSDSAEPRVER